MSLKTPFKLYCLQFLLAFLVHRSNAFQVFTNNTLPPNLTIACNSALLSDLGCDPTVAALQDGYYYAKATLDSICTTTCTSALAAYESSVIQSCKGQTWNGYYNATDPIAIIPDIMQYQYSLACLMDSGRYCNVVAAQAATLADPLEPLGDGVIGGGNVSACDLCFVKKLRSVAGSVYFNGPLLSSSSIYQSFTSSCNIDGYPFTTSTPSFELPTPTSTSTNSATQCSGQTYTIKDGDDCHSISTSQGIATSWLLLDNGLAAFCSDFPTSGNLCLVNTCNVYTLQQNDTCDSVASKNNITTTQLLAWNPAINTGCNNLNKTVGYQICVGAPGVQYNPALTTFAVVTNAVTSATVPTDLATGTNIRCERYYTAIVGDYCNLICLKYGISLADFVFLNPAINSNCTNLYADESYCVQPVGDINTYPGRPGYTSTMAATSIAQIAFSSLPDATYVPSLTSSNDSFPLADGTRTDCSSYVDGNDFQMDLSKTSWSTNCEALVAIWGVTLDELGFWNPSLGNASLSTCALEPGYQYCAVWYYSTSEPVATIEASFLPIRDGASSNCTEYYPVIAPDTCQDILQFASLSIAQFYAYNPAVKADCSLLLLGYRYCIRTPDYVDLSPDGTASPSLTNPATTISTAPIGGQGPASPTQTGQPVDCIRWYTAQSGDSCGSIENANFLTNEEFHTWNPAVSSDCSAGLWAGYAYCVATNNDNPSRTALPAASTTTSAAPAPSPTQTNSIISSCNKYAIASSGDYCSKFAQENGISASDLYAWNSVLGSDGVNCNTAFFANYYYCIGVSS